VLPAHAKTPSQKKEGKSIPDLEIFERYRRGNRRKFAVLIVLSVAVVVMSGACLFAGSSHMSISECAAALMKQGTSAHVRIIWNIRLPRVLAAVIAGAGLSLAGLIMQTTLHNPMASPSTLGVSNAAVFGANLSILAFSGGVLSTGDHLAGDMAGMNPYAAGMMAFLFSAVSILLILALCSLRAFAPNVVVLAGIAVGSMWTAATTILQFYATDVGLAAAVVWNFGDLGRATYHTNTIMALVVGAGTAFFMLMSWRYNALLSGEPTARSIGVPVGFLRFFSLLLASVMTAVCVSFLGIISFVGIICPHIIKKLLGQDHRYTIPASALSGSLLLLLADTFARSMGNGSALPVGAITSLLGAPFFFAMIFSREGRRSC